jgi:hypothetical protein
MLSGVLLVVITITFMMQGTVSGTNNSLAAQMKSAGVALDPSFYVPGTKPQFVSSSPGDGAWGTSQPNITALITVKDAQLTTVSYNWNGTNYSIYDQSLAIAYNFEDSALLGENGSVAVDISAAQANCTAMGNANTTILLGMGEGTGTTTADGSASHISAALDGGDRGTADAGTTTTQVMETAPDYQLSYSNDAYNGWNLLLTSGSGSGNMGTVSDYVVTSSQNNKQVVLSGALTGLASGINYRLYWEDTTGPEWTDGLVGKALEFDGRDDHLDLGSFALSGKTQLTFSAWIRPRRLSGQQYVFVKNGPIYWYLNGDRMTFGTLTSVTGSNHLGGTISLKANEWAHVAAVYNGTHKVTYVNGAVDNRGDATGTTGGEGCPQIARYNNGGCEGGPSSHFNGTIDEFAIYDRALDASEIMALYNAQRAKSGRWASLSSWGNGALRLNGIDDYLACGTPAALDVGTGDFTVELWAKALGGTYDRAIVSKGGWGSVGFFISEAYSPANQYYFGVTDSAGYKSVSLGLGDTFDWKHIVGVKTNNHIEAWVNGAKVDETSPAIGNLSNPSQALWIGRSFNGYLFNGSIDDVRVWKRALSPAEIAMHYRTGLSKYTANAWFFENRNSNLPVGAHNYTLYSSGGYRKDMATETRTVKVCPVPLVPC